MPPLLSCLCQNNQTGCVSCAAKAGEGWTRFAAQHPGATPGQLMEQAIQQDRPEVVLGILQNSNIDINKPCDPQQYGSVSPLVTALEAGSARIVALIAGQPQFDLTLSLPEYESYTWVCSSSLELLRLYLSIPGSDANQQDGNGKTLLHEVIHDFKSQNKLRELLSLPGIVIDPKQVDGTTPLYRAALVGNADAVELLLERGAEINNRNNDNLWTVLICAVAEDRIPVVEQLLRHRELQVNAADDIGNTALHIAAERGHTRAVELLLQRSDLEINHKNCMGWTALSKAAFAGHLEVVRRLLARSDLGVNLVDQDRQTPLFHAASTGHLEVVSLLLADPRTNPAISNRPAYQTALDMATALGFAAVAELLRKSVAGEDELSPGDLYMRRQTGEQRTTSKVAIATPKGKA